MFKTKLIFQLSLLGLLMGFATVWFIPAGIEIYFWSLIFIYCAYRIGSIRRGNYFLHGVLTSIFISVWFTFIHLIFFREYINLHPEELSIYKVLSLENSPKFALLITGPMFGIIFGIFLGTLSVIASLILHKKKNKRSSYS